MKAKSVYYTPQQVASFFAIRKDTLLFYDRIGLFSPALRKENGYRYYSANQLYELDAVLTLRDLGFSIAEIKESKETMSVESFLSLLGKEESRLSEKIVSYQDLLAVNNSIRQSTLQAIEAKKEHLIIEHLPRQPIIAADINGSGDKATSDEEWTNAYSRLLTATDSRMIIHTGSIIGKEEASRSFGAIIDSVYVLDHTARFYRKYLNEIESHGLSICSSIYEELTISYAVTSDEYKHVTKLMAKTK